MNNYQALEAKRKQEIYRQFSKNYNNQSPITDFFSKTLQESNSMQNYSDMAILKMATLVNETPFLPYINAMSLSEYDSYVAKLYDDIILDLLGCSCRLPLCILPYDTLQRLFNYNFNGIIYAIDIKLIKFLDALCLIISCDDDERVRMRVTSDDIIEVDVYTIMSSLSSVSEDQYNKDSTNLDESVRVVVEEVTYTTTQQIQLTVRKAHISFESFDLFNTTHDTYHITKEMHTGTVKLAVREFNVTSVLDGVSTVIRVMLPSMVIISANSDATCSYISSIYNNKMNKVFELDCTRLQASAFKRQSITLMEAAEEVATTPLDKNLHNTYTKINELSEKAAQYLRWNDVKLNNHTGIKMHLPRIKLPYHVPAYSDNRDKNLANYPIAFNFKTSFLNLPYYDTKVISNTMIEDDIFYESLPTPITSNVTLIIFDDAQRVMYAELSIIDTYTRSTNSTARKLSSSEDEKICTIEVDETSYKMLSGGSIIVKLVDIPNREVKLSSTEFTRKVTLKSVIMCDKHAINFLDHVEAELSGKFWFGEDSCELIVTEKRAVDFVTREYGRLYGIAFYCDEKKSILSVKNTKRPIYIPNIAVIRHDVAELDVDWGWFRYQMTHQKKTLIQCSDGLLRWIELSITRIAQGDDEFRLLINTHLNNDYFYKHAYMKNLSQDMRKASDNPLYIDYFNDKTSRSGAYKEKEAFDLYFNACYIDCDLNVSYQRTINQTTNYARAFFSERNTESDKINANIMHQIVLIKQRITDIEKTVEEVQAQIRDIQSALEPSFIKELSDAAISYAGGTIAKKLLGPLFRKLSTKLVNNLNKIISLANTLLSLNPKVVTSAMKFKNGVIPVDMIGMKRMKYEIISRSLNKSTKCQQLYEIAAKNAAAVIPSFSKLCKLQRIDGVSQMLLLEQCARGIIPGKGFASAVANKRYLRNNGVLRPMLNVEKDSIYLPQMAVYYRPLDVGFPAVNKFLYNKMVNKQKTAKDLLYNSMDMTIRRPGHSYAVFTDYEFKPSGDITLTKIFTGIGELNVRGAVGSDINSGIGGVSVKYHSVGKMVDSQGNRIFKAGSYTDSGYTQEDVLNLHKTLFKSKPTTYNTNNIESYDKLWHQIANQVDKKIIQGDEVYKACIPDSAKLSVIRNIIDDPPSFDYGLLSNNCQTYTKDLVNYMRSDVKPRTWSIHTNEKAESILAAKYIEELNSAIDAFSSDTTELLSRLVRSVEIEEARIQESGVIKSYSIVQYNSEYVEIGDLEKFDDYLQFLDDNKLFSSSYFE